MRINYTVGSVAMQGIRRADVNTCKDSRYRFDPNCITGDYHEIPNDESIDMVISDFEKLEMFDIREKDIVLKSVDKDL